MRGLRHRAQLLPCVLVGVGNRSGWCGSCRAGACGPIQSADEGLAQHLAGACDVENLEGPAAQGAGGDGRDLPSCGQHPVGLCRADGMPRRELVGQRLGQHLQGGDAIRLRREGHPAVRQVHAAARQALRAWAGRVGVGPVRLFHPVLARQLQREVARVQATKVQVGTLGVELGQEIQQGLRGRLLALERVEGLGVARVVGEGVVHDRHERDRVGGELHEGAVAVLELLAGGVREPDRVAGAVDEVLRVVHSLTRLVDLTAVDGGVQRSVDRAGGDAPDLVEEFGEDRVEHRGVPRALDVQHAGELALAVQVLNERGDGCLRAADGGHARRGVDRGLHLGELRVLGAEGLQRLRAQFDDGHRPGLVAGELALALAHEAGAVAGHGHGVLQGQPAGAVGGTDLAQGLADDRGRAQPEIPQQVGQRDLDGGDGDLGGFQVEVLLVVVDLLHQRPAGFALHDLVDRGEALGEEAGDARELLAHLPVLGAEAGVDPDRAGGSRGVRGEDGGPLLALGEALQPLDGFGSVGGADDATGAAVVAAGERPGDIQQIGGLMLGKPVAQVTGGQATAGGQEAGDRQQRGRGLAGLPVDQWAGRFCVRCGAGAGISSARTSLSSGPLLVQCGGVLQLLLGRSGDHHVRIRATEAEAGHTGHRAAGVFRPLARILDYLESLGVEVDVRVRTHVVQARWQHALTHRHQDLHHAGHARRGLGVAEVRLGGSQQGRVIRIAPRAQHLAERASLNRVAQDGAGAVGLHVVHGRRVDPCVLVGSAQHRGLRLRVRCGNAVGAAVGVDRRALDHAEDVVTGCHGVGESLEDDHARAVGTHDAVGVLGEGVNLAGRGQHPGLGEGNGSEGVGQQIHATGDRDLGAAVAQGNHRLVDRHQRGGTGGVHSHRRPAEVKSIGNAIGNDGAGVAGQGIRVGYLRVGDDEVRVVVVRGSHEHAHVVPAQ